MKTLKEAMSDTIEMYEFIGQLRAENEALRKENALLLSKEGGTPGVTVVSAVESKMIKSCKKIAARHNISNWNMPNVKNSDDSIVPFSEYYKRVTRDFMYGGPFDDVGLTDLKEFFKEEIRDCYNSKVEELKKKETEEGAEKEE